MMTQVYCKKCGYVKTEKRRCIWCTGDMDTLNAFKEADLQNLIKRFRGLEGKMKVNYIVAMGLEGFTPAEIEAITDKPADQVEAILTHAGVVGQ